MTIKAEKKKTCQMMVQAIHFHTNRLNLLTMSSTNAPKQMCCTVL